MQEIINQALVNVQGMLRYRWHALALAWALALLGWMGVMLLPDTYEARAKVYVDTDTVLRPLLKGLAAENDVMTEVNMMSRALLSRPQLEKVARETDLYLRAQTPRELEELIESLRLRIAIEVLPQAPSLYAIRFEDSDRAMSARVVQKLLDTFVEDTLLTKREDSSGAQRFLEQQISDLERRLREAEDRLAEFKQKNLGLMPGEEGDYYTRLQAAIARQERLRQDLKVAQDRRDESAAQLEGEVPTFGLLNRMAESASPLAGQISENKKRLETLLLQYTEKHPEVVALKERIATLEEQQKRDKPVGMPSASTGELAAINSLDQNPAYQRMKISVMESEVAATEARSKLREADNEVARLRALVNTIPEVEAQLARLNRDYEVNKAQHVALLQRLESARLSENVEQSRDDVRFRIIEPPAAPLMPVSPNRPLFVTIVLLAAIAGGLGLALLLHQVNPVFATRHSLRETTGLPVLGSISMALSPVAVKSERRTSLRMSFAAGLLVVFFIATLAGVQVATTALQALFKG
jgi:polysaccharide chain length determinant protein (PEP-CTERM system associated)